MDLLRADRDVAAAAADLRRLGTAVDWDSHRHVAGKRGLLEIESESASPLRDALVSHVCWLTVARVAQPAEKRFAIARAEPCAVVRLERDVQLGMDETLSKLLAARAPGEARAYFDALGETASVVAEPARTLRETRDEAFRRLGIDDVASRFLGVSIGDLAQTARAFLEATADLAREAADSRAPWPLDLDARLARRAPEGWPSRLGWRSVTSLLPGLNLRGAISSDPPRALGAASFARALETVGAAFHRSLASSSTAFVLREGPLAPDALRTGLVFAAALGQRTFHARVLGLGSGRASDQARALHAAFLLDARFSAMRVALRVRGDFEALTALTLGAPLDARLEGAWPAWRDEDLARFVAILTTPELVTTLHEREGDDWFRNPRAFATLRDLVQSPPALAKDAAPRLAHAFEEVLA